ncbi:BLUF domain-containing protein [Marinomonas sp. THO17]|uniref:BLUF domain-containing protein n=1 Tax=Marinomonas sp. THO17 TaxID=3149048 RepID=UPI00336C28D1
MISITYISKAEKVFSDSELQLMLEGFIEKNRLNNISGVLLYNGAGTFIQIIEGEEDSVLAIYEKIKKDKRHSNIVCLRKVNIAQRSFKQWRMGFRNLKNNSIKKDITTSFLEDENLEHFVSNDTDFALKMLTNFRNKVQELVF